MLDFKKIENDYNEYVHNRSYYKKIKAEPHIYFKEHIDQIDPYMDEYYEYENSSDKKKLKAFLLKHPELKTYLSLCLEKMIFKDRMKKSYISSELENIGRCVTYTFFQTVNNDGNKPKEIKCFAIYDLDSDVEYVYSNSNEKVVEHIKNCLTKQKVLLSEIFYSELSLVKVLYMNIKSSPKFSELTNNSIRNKVSTDLIKARVFDCGVMLNDNENNLPKMVDEYKELIRLYDAKIINKDEYYIRLYKYRILTECDVIKMYLDADDEQKKYIIDAYMQLSVRTTSKEINDEVLKRIRKKTGTI